MGLEVLVLLLVVGISIGFRYVMIHDGYFQFHFEQVRDAIISRSIYTESDVKVLGPPAGNSNETIYHGVLYYYLIGFLYFLSHGDPKLVVNVFCVLSGLGMWGVYVLTKKLGGRRAAVFAALMWSFNLSIAQINVQLFNIALASWIIPWVFWFLIMAWNEGKAVWYLGLFLSLGILHQAGIYLGVYWLGINIYLLFIKRIWKQRNQFVYLILGNVVYLGTVFSMILGQLMLWRAGVFHFSDLSGVTGSSLNLGLQELEALGLVWQRLIHLSFFNIDIVSAVVG